MSERLVADVVAEYNLKRGGRTLEAPYIEDGTLLYQPCNHCSNAGRQCRLVLTCTRCEGRNEECRGNQILEQFINYIVSMSENVPDSEEQIVFPGIQLPKLEQHAVGYHQPIAFSDIFVVNDLNAVEDDQIFNQVVDSGYESAGWNVANQVEDIFEFQNQARNADFPLYEPAFPEDFGQQEEGVVMLEDPANGPGPTWKLASYAGDDPLDFMGYEYIADGVFGGL